jgi:hypothetical protein
MIRTITDADIDAWLNDLRSGCGPEGDPPLVEVFERLVAERDEWKHRAAVAVDAISLNDGYHAAEYELLAQRCAKAEAEVERLTKALELVEFSADDNETRLTEYIVKLERVSEVARELQATADNVDVWNNKPSGPMASDYEARGLARQHLRAALAALEEAKP